MSGGSINLDPYHAPKVCRRCRGNMVFQGVGEYKCDHCGFIDYDDYGVVRCYIEEHHGATAGEIAVATGISQSQINAMLRDERIQIAGDSKVFLKCVSCGTDIFTGMYCGPCGKIAAAAAARKKKNEEIEKHRKRVEGISGVGISKPSKDSGAKRFIKE